MLGDLLGGLLGGNSSEEKEKKQLGLFTSLVGDIPGASMLDEILRMFPGSDVLQKLLGGGK